MAVLTDAEIEELRFHLGYGNVGIGGYPYTPDGFLELFEQVIGEYLSTGAETSATAAITANTTATITPASMTDIAANVRLIVDSGDDAEVVVVKYVTATTFTAKFAKDHAASGYPIAVYSGVAWLRVLLHQANEAFFRLTGRIVGDSAGLKRVEEIEWYGPGAKLAELRSHYQTVVMQLASLCRVQPNTELWGGAVTRMETY